jgi:3-phenylpropionate/trans-cinnamate dioxygenase ferredoxin reductase component
VSRCQIVYYSLLSTRYSLLMSDQTSRRIVVIGGGPAGVFAALAAKRTDPAAHVIILTEEGCEPYEKPPLSKAVLTGKALPEDALIAGPGGVIAHKVVLERHACCTAIDRAARQVRTASGQRYRYDALVLATGSLMRELPQFPIAMPHVHYLRTAADARALKASLQSAKHLVLIGGGLIGLEVAASARTVGVKTTVLEIAPRILARVCDENTAACIAQAHSKHGVEIHTGVTIKHVEPTAAGIDITTKDGHALSADIVGIGCGVKPKVVLAAAAELAVDDGIVVDEHCSTSDPNILAAGDATRFPGPHGLLRLENWRHAQDHGVIAGRNAAGAHEAYRAVPSFWSEQYDLYIQGVGWPSPQPDTHIHRQATGGGPLIFGISKGAMICAMGINRQRDIAAARRLIERQIPVDSAALADPNRPLAGMLKATA